MIWFSVFVGVAGEDRPTVVNIVESKDGAKIIVKPKESIVRPKRGKRPTVNLKTAAGTGINQEKKKTWMMQLPHPVTHGL